LRYGFDGSGGLQFNLVAQGETQNKRVGLAVTATSYTLAGPIGGFPQSVGPFAGLIDGSTVEVRILPSTSCLQYLPHINGGHIAATSSSVICCNTNFTRDTTLEQQRTASIFYNIAPAVQVILRYDLNNTLNNFGNTPLLIPFSAPVGYTGKYPNGYGINASLNNSVPTREIDQLYEWDVHAQIGKGALRASYLSYESANTSFQHGNTGGQPCSPCTISGELLVGGNTPNYNNYAICGNLTCGSTLTVFNDQTVSSLTPALGFNKVVISSKTLTHDIVANLLYPLTSRSTAELSFNSTVTSNNGNYFQNLEAPAQFSCIYSGSLGAFSNQYGFGNFERFNTLRGSFHTGLAKSLDAQLSLYVNQYQYHLADPNSLSYNTSPVFVNKYSYFTSPRLGFEWRPHSDIAVRASAGAGISPIDISQLLGSNSPPQAYPGPPSPTLYYTNYLPNPNLKAETSFGEDLGASLRFGRYYTLSTDIYNTVLHGQYFSNYQQAGFYLGLPLYVTQTRNLAHSKYQGFELTLTSHPPVGLFWSVQGSLQRGFAYDIPASFYASAGGPYSTNLTIISNENFNGGACGIGRVAYAQGFAVLGWQNIRGFQVSSNFTYYGNNNGFYRPAFITIDLDGTIPLTSRASLTVALGNLTNIYPDLYYKYGQFAVIPYAHVDPNGFIGQTNTVQNVGPRHLSAYMNFKL